MKYHLSFRINTDEFADYLRWRSRRSVAFAAVIALGLLALNGLTLWIGTPLEFALLFSVPAVLLLIATRTPYLIRWQIRRQARSLLGQTATFDIGPGGIDEDMVGMASHVAWNSVTDVHDNGKVVVVSRDRLPVLWMAASAFSSVEERVEIVAFMRAQIAASRRQDSPA